MLNGLDLFSGIGGITKALENWVRPVAYCEIDRYAQSTLLSRMADKSLPEAPIWDDIKTLTKADWPFWESCDIIYGGFPCQDISTAGNGAGLEGERSGLFFEIIRLCGELRPHFVFLENVPAITTRGGLRVISEFTKIGYDCRWTIVSAAELGAPHLRKRWFLLAHSNRSNIRKQQGGQCRANRESEIQLRDNGEAESLANPESPRLPLTWGEIRTQKKHSGPTYPSWWQVEPPMGRVVNGLRHRVDRVKGLGNAVVPLQAKEAFERLIGYK